MALSLQHTPGTYFSAHGDLLFTILDAARAGDPDTYPDYKYVCDIWIDGEQVARLKSVPDPDNLCGIFNIGNIVRSYLTTVFNPTASQLRAQEIGSEEFYVDVVCRFGEEYDFTLYTNLLEDTTRKYFNHYNGRLLGQNTNLSAYVDKALSVRPTRTPVYRSSNFNFIPYLPSDTDNVTLTIRTYNYAGTLAATVTQAIAPSGANVLQLYNVSPGSINTHTPGLINETVKHYTVEFVTPNASPDSLYQFDLVCEPRYEVFTLHFMNRFGGFESRSFTKVSRKTVEIQKGEFGRLPYTMNASGVISYYNANNVYNETRSVYSSQYMEKMTLNTDILTDGEYTWLGDLMLSPLVYMEMSGYFIPIAIVASDYEYRKSINDRLTNLTLNIEFGDQFNAQYR
jgi:hypothetical protein